MPSNRDIVVEARELLARATPQWEQSQLCSAYVISLTEGHEVVMAFAEFTKSGDLELEFKNADNNMALAIRAPDLLRALADEVERLREELDDAYLPKHLDELP